MYCAAAPLVTWMTNAQSSSWAPGTALGPMPCLYNSIFTKQDSLHLGQGNWGHPKLCQVGLKMIRRGLSYIHAVGRSQSLFRSQGFRKEPQRENGLYFIRCPSDNLCVHFLLLDLSFLFFFFLYPQKLNKSAKEAPVCSGIFYTQLTTTVIKKGNTGPLSPNIARFSERLSYCMHKHMHVHSHTCICIHRLDLPNK